MAFRATTANQAAGHRLLTGDGAYHSAPEVTTSKAKSKPFTKRRARAEHAITRPKDYRVLRQHRRHCDTINETTRTVPVPHNLKIDYP